MPRQVIFHQYPLEKTRTYTELQGHFYVNSANSTQRFMSSGVRKTSPGVLMDNAVEIINAILAYEYFYLAFFCVMICCGLGAPLTNSDTLILLTAGFSHQANLNVYVIAALAILGMSLGDSLIYYIGYKYGQRALSFPPFKWVFSPERFFKACQLVHKRGAYMLIYARLIPGSRTWTIFTAATLKMPYSKYLIVNTAAMTVTVTCLVTIGRLFFPSLETVKTYLPYCLLAIVAFITLSILMKGFSFQKKRTPGDLVQEEQEIKSTIKA